METNVLDNDMLNNDKDGKSLQEILSRGYETNSVDYIKKGFEIFKQEAGSYIGFLLIIAIAYIVAGMIPFIGKFASIFLAPLGVGGFIMAKKIDKNEPHEFSNFFDGKNDYRDLVIMVLIQSLIMWALMLVAIGPNGFLITMGWKKMDMTDMNALMSMYAGMGKRFAIIWLPMIIISTMWIFSSMFIVFPKFKAWDAMEASRKVVFKKFFNWLGFLILLILFNMAGAICLGVGLLVTIPSSMCAVYAAFEDVIGTNVRP